MEIRVTPHHFIISFPYRPYLVEAVKRLPKREYIHHNKTWAIPKNYFREVEVFAHKYGFKWGEVTNKPEQDYKIPELPELTMDIPLKITMRDYQRKGVAYNLQHKRVIIGDDMGLGKTLQAIATIIGADMLYQQTGQNPSFPCLIVAPSSVKYSWLEKWQQYTGRNYAMILNDSVKRNWWLYYEANMAKVFITNYESLKKYFVDSIEVHTNPETGKKMPLRLNYIKFRQQIQLFNSIIIDESHRIKDSSTLQSKFCQGLAYAKKWIFLLTGTPVVNKPKDLIQQLTVMGTMNYFGNYKGFVDKFCQGDREASNLKELNFVLNTHCFYRRNKIDVAKELPPKSRQVVLCDITNRNEYDDAERDLVKYLQSYRDATDAEIRTSMKGKALFQVSVLKNISARGKLKDVIEYINDVLEDGEKIGIFVHLKEIAFTLKQQYKHSAMITGSDNLQERQAAIKRFKDDERCTTAILSIMAAGTGVDGLQYATSLACFVEQPWTAAACDQAEDRFNRIGQTKPVTIIYFIGRTTIDEHIYQIIEKKRDIAKAITGDTEDIETNMINDILDLYNKKNG